MGFLDKFKRDDSAPFQDPSKADPEEALKRARKGLAETGTYIDQNGNRRKLPKGAKDPMSEALDKMEKRLGEGKDEGDGS
jgi:hypothetical protein